METNPPLLPDAYSGLEATPARQFLTRQIAHRNLPEDVLEQLVNLPAEAKYEFLRQYQRKAKSSSLAYVFHFLFGLSYGYQDKWGKQLLFWLTGFGFIIGWWVNLFRMQSSIRKVNHKNARQLMTQVVRRYGFQGRPAPAEKGALPKPRNVRRPLDPTNIELQDLARGFLLDYNLKTWQVVSETQADWNLGGTERHFRIASEPETAFLVLRMEGGQWIALFQKLYNIHALSADLQNTIRHTRVAPNVLFVEGSSYYLESRQEGYFFHISAQLPPRKIVRWEYFDSTRFSSIRIDVLDDTEFIGYVGDVVPLSAFSEILPGAGS